MEGIVQIGLQNSTLVWGVAYRKKDSPVVGLRVSTGVNCIQPAKDPYEMLSKTLRELDSANFYIITIPVPSCAS